ncbi:MAG: trypsin-like peptidase domain-containing protein [Acidobacteriota bacterium]|nr:trypsin-like peptidase domain-containing protein [Acidobacteriota bacterium]
MSASILLIIILAGLVAPPEALAATPAPSIEAATPAWAAQTEGPVRVGDVILSRFESPAFEGTAPEALPQRVWREVISLPEASYIAPHFSRFVLPPGAELVVRSPDGSRSWTYTGFGKTDRPLPEGFWGIHVPGDTAIVELHSRAPLERGAVVVDSFAHGFTKGFDKGFPQGPGTESVCGLDDSREAKCFQSSNPTIYNESRAVARLLINGVSLCTGWLVGNQGHLMTNNHCIDSSSDALNTDYEFMAEGGNCSTNCRSTLACPGTVEATSATLIQTDVNLDYTLVLLPSNVTGTYGFMQMRQAGADLEERIYLPGHPAGWGKQIAADSTHTQNPSGFCEVDSLSEPACVGGSVAEVGYYCDTRGGSSGSPVLATADHCVVALHHCRGSAACTSSGADPNRGVPVENIIADLGTNLPVNALCGAGGRQLGAVTIDEQIRTVPLTGFSNPRVVMGPPSFNGSQASTIRVRNVTSSSFDHNLQEWDYLDGGHVNESIGYLALDAGNSSLGSLAVEARSVSINHNWTSVSFTQSFSSAPVVLAQVATFNGSQAVVTRVRNVTASGFDIRLQEEEGNDGTHASETVHWIAVEQGSATVGGNTFVVATRSNVDHGFASISFGQSLSSPVFLAAMQTFNGSDPAALRHRNLTTTGVEVKVEEEESLDSEVTHFNSEVVGYIAISN